MPSAFGPKRNSAWINRMPRIDGTVGLKDWRSPNMPANGRLREPYFIVDRVAKKAHLKALARESWRRELACLRERTRGFHNDLHDRVCALLRPRAQARLGCRSPRHGGLGASATSPA